MKKIFLVDDEADFCFFLKKNLEITGNFKVTICTDARAALGGIIASKPDVILLDILMPGKDGRLIAAALGKHKETKHIPVVYVSAAAAQTGGTVQKDSSKTHPLIAKPVRIKELLGTLYSLISTAD